MVEKKEKVVCAPVYLRIGSEGFSGLLCTRGKKFEFIPMNEKQSKDLKRTVNLYEKRIKNLERIIKTTSKELSKEL